MALNSGTQLGSYEIVSLLGAGGMGEVYRAHDSRLGRDVALKVLPAALAGDPSRRARFEQEARSASALNHPNIVTVFDIGVHYGLAYIVTELVEGEPLRALIQRGPVAARKLLDIAVQLADGLAAAHAAGIIHRDLKPENVMVTREGRVKILDFGLAKQTGALTPADGRTASLEQTHPGTILGTISYMSPEQARGAALDFHSDQFSFGLILYEAACGKKAFQKPESVQTLAAIITEDPPPLEVKLPAPLRWVIDRCLAKDPHERYDSTRNLCQELRSLRNHLSESFTAGSGVAAPVSKSRSKRVRLALVWLAGALIAAGTGFVLAQLFPRQQGPDMAHYRFTPLVNEVPIASYAAWSPDGKSFAYTGLVNGADQIFVRRLDNPVASQVTRSPAGPVAFWSPDSSRVFYYEDYMGIDTKLWSVAVAGGQPELVTKDFRTAALSSDGKVLTVLRRESGVDSVWVSSPPGAQWHKYSPAPFAKTEIYNFPAMSFSPDGSKVLLSILGPTATEKQAVHEWWLIPYPEGSGYRPRRVLQTLPSPTNIPRFSWMPDSRHVVISMATRSQAAIHLWMADTESDAYSLLTSGLDSQIRPAVSPDGQKVIFADVRTDFDLEEVPLTGGTPQTLIATSRWEFDPAWSPVARELAYVTDRDGPQEIWLKSAEETWSRPLVTPDQFPEPTAGLWGPAFSPDGSRIAYIRLRSDEACWIWISPTSGGTPARLTHEGVTVTEGPPAWSPEGSWLAYDRDEQGKAALVKFRLGSLEAPVVVKGDAIEGFIPAWSPKGDWITFLSAGGEWFLVSPDGKNERRLGALKTDYLLWSRDGKTLYGVRPNQEHHQVLFSLDVRSGRQKDIRDLGSDFTLDGPWVPSIRFSLAPDGESFAMFIRKERSDLWMLEDFNLRPGLRGWLRK